MFRDPRRPLPTLTDAQFTGYVAGLMRAGGWRRVSVAAAMGHLGTDVAGVGADGRRFADTVRELRRGDVALLVTAGDVPEPVRQAAARAATTVVDGAGLAWWAGIQG